jgi:hypothetical protein
VPEEWSERGIAARNSDRTRHGDFTSSHRHHIICRKSAYRPSSRVSDFSCSSREEPDLKASLLRTFRLRQVVRCSQTGPQVSLCQIETIISVMCCTAAPLNLWVSTLAVVRLVKLGSQIHVPSLHRWCSLLRRDKSPSSISVGHVSSTTPQSARSVAWVGRGTRARCPPASVLTSRFPSRGDSDVRRL